MDCSRSEQAFFPAPTFPLDKVVASGKIGPMNEKEAAEAVAAELLQKYPGLADMVERGLILLPRKPNRPGAYPRLESVTPPGTAARLLDEEREDRPISLSGRGISRPGLKSRATSSRPIRD
jgi:hypothetical protein